jgi:threonine synthase
VHYISTRGAAAPKRFTEILLEGLAPDGGLYVAEAYPKADLAAWRGLGYAELAFQVLSRFIDDLSELEVLVRRAASAARMSRR